ncbi:LTA synthase family protein [uncultured Mitsuokella sp.]|uniref:LTA synthase family protein n=1 Tax=uncultured Mitsuokella sp. TaxID=453120 RepID=UPI0025F571E7|nr:alkaline phosphatase family protein [uncultured Mitsuokella sp.]
MGILKGLKVFVFYLAVLSVFRMFFIFWMASYMGAGTGSHDVLTAIWRGTRLSMQTAGALTLVSFVPGFLLHYLWPRWERCCVLVLNAILLVPLSILYVASFPFYRQFHANFNQMLFTGANDDLYALLITMVQQYYLPVRLAGALLLAYVLWRILRAFLDNEFFENLFVGMRLPRLVRWLGRLAFLYLTYIVVLLGIFGGSLGWQTSVNWENAGVTKDEFLNEAILDNVQACYRAYSLNERMLACNGLDFTTDDIRTLAAKLANKPADTDDLDVYLTREAQGAQIEKPKQVVVIVSESFANWPLLDKYKDIPISQGMRSLIAEDDTDYCPTFLPNGASTVSAVTGVVTGFADANLYLTTMPESFAAPYPTASAPQMQKLGYDTNFWYAGPSTWERIGAFTQAQGFAHFYSRGDFGDVPGSVWGCEDEVLYEKVLAGLDADTPSFNVVLNASNHSPYDLDLDAKGFDREAVREALPEDHQQDEELLKELGHYWYADRELAKFVKEIKEKCPDSLIVIVGDHADRYNIDKTPTTYERYGIPFIITGRGIHKGTLLPDSAGSQIDIMPTIYELIAPQGFSYMSVGSSLTRTNRQGVNYGFFITRHAIGKADTVPLVPESVDGGEAPGLDQQAMEDYINAVRSISWWRPKYGPMLDESKLQDR